MRKLFRTKVSNNILSNLKTLERIPLEIFIFVATEFDEKLLDVGKYSNICTPVGFQII